MVSHKHKCIFVHVPKAAGTSIERFFMDDLDIDMENRHALLLGANNNKNLGPRRISHLTAAEYVSLHFVSKDLFDQYYKFAFVRNPVDKLFSTYKYWKFDKVTTFNYFILKLLPLFLQDTKENYFVKPQYEYIYSINGDCLVDYIGKLEEIKHDFNEIKSKLGLDSQSLKHYNRSSEKAKEISFMSKLKLIYKNRISLNNLNFSRNKNKELSQSAIDYINDIYQLDFKYLKYPKLGK